MEITKTCAMCHEDLALDEENYWRRWTSLELSTENSQAYCKPCCTIYKGQLPADPGDGRRYVPVERIEIDPAFAAKDAARRASLVRRTG